VNAQADLDVDASVVIRGTCPVDYTICGKTVEFEFGGPGDMFHLIFDADALDTLLRIGPEALRRLQPHAAEIR
jgi:hypothetical protein